MNYAEFGGFRSKWEPEQEETDRPLPPRRIPFEFILSVLIDAMKYNVDKIGRQIIIPQYLKLFLNPEDRKLRREYEDIVITELVNELLQIRKEISNTDARALIVEFDEDGELEKFEVGVTAEMVAPGEKIEAFKEIETRAKGFVQSSEIADAGESVDIEKKTPDLTPDDSEEEDTEEEDTAESEPQAEIDEQTALEETVESEAPVLDSEDKSDENDTEAGPVDAVVVEIEDEVVEEKSEPDSDKQEETGDQIEVAESSSEEISDSAKNDLDDNEEQEETPFQIDREEIEESVESDSEPTEVASSVEEPLDEQETDSQDILSEEDIDLSEKERITNSLNTVEERISEFLSRHPDLSYVKGNENLKSDVDDLKKERESSAEPEKEIQKPVEEPQPTTSEQDPEKKETDHKHDVQVVLFRNNQRLASRYLKNNASMVIGAGKSPEVNWTIEDDHPNNISEKHLELINKNGRIICSILGINGAHIDRQYFEVGITTEVGINSNLELESVDNVYSFRFSRMLV